MLKLAVRYALICGLFLVIVFHLSFYFGSNPQIDLTHLLFDVILFGVFIYFAGKEFKAYYSDGIYHFWQGMSMGFLVYFGAAMVFILAQIFFYTFFPEGVMDYQESATNFLYEREALYKEQFGEKGFDAQLSEIASITKWDLIWSSAFKKIIAGFFVTPVISIILRKQPK